MSVPKWNFTSNKSPPKKMYTQLPNTTFWTVCHRLSSQKLCWTICVNFF